MTFDPLAHKIMLPGRKDKNGRVGPAQPYLQVKHRVRWLREDHPNADIESHVVSIDDAKAVFQVRISIPGEGAATATGTESKAAFFDYIEKAETVALGRALAILGYGIDFTDEFEEGKEEAEPRDYKSIEPPQDQPKPHAKANGWPENAKAAPSEPASVLKPGEKATIPAAPAPSSVLENLARLAIKKGIDLGERCVADFGKLPDQLTVPETIKLFNKMSKE